MKVVAVRGPSNSGKTETIIALLRELRRRGFSVVTAKDVHQAGFSIDTPGKDSARLGEAGGEAVVIRAEGETSFVYRRRFPAEEIVTSVAADFLVVEGFRDLSCANLACARELDELRRQIDEQTIAISGVVASSLVTYEGVPAVSALSEVEKLADVVEAGATEVGPPPSSQAGA